MPIKQVFESDLAVYPLTTRDVPRTALILPDGTSYFYMSPVDTYRIYTMYIDFFRGIFTLKDPTYPSEFEIHLVCAMKQDEWPSWSVQTLIWNGKTGEFKEIRQTVTAYNISYMFSAPDGTIWGTSLYSNYLIGFNPVDWTMTDHPIPLTDFGANIGASGSGGVSNIAVDPARDVLLTRLSSDGPSQISVCQLSTGDWLRTINMAGTVKYIFVAEPPMAYAVETTGNMTAFNYETGEVTGVLHTGLLSAGATTWTDTGFTWDPFTRRILFCHNDPDTLPDGDCNTRVKGYYPVPLPIGLTPPIPLRYPQVGKTVPVFNRVYGATGEGVVGQEVTYIVGDDSAATVSPSRQSSGSNGTLTVQLVGTLAGANSLTSETTVP